MNGPSGTANRRILVIDDNEAIHQDFRKILGPEGEGAIALAASEAALFGEAPPQWQGFELDSAYQGEEALAMVVRALAENRPYALAFVDVRSRPAGTASRPLSASGRSMRSCKSRCARPIPIIPGRHCRSV
jgi:CheY-like chemotaxis protein